MNYQPGQWVAWRNNAGHCGDGIIKEAWSDSAGTWYLISGVWVEESLIVGEVKNLIDSGSFIGLPVSPFFRDVHGGEQ